MLRSCKKLRAECDTNVLGDDDVFTFLLQTKAGERF
jgi:hypothetical protein